MSRSKRAFPKRGDVWWVNFDPSLGTESTKIRPAIIVSNDLANEFLERVQVVPLTSDTEKVYPSETLITLGKKKSKAAADQIATASKMRLKKKIGTVSVSEMEGLAHVIKIQLGL